MPRASEYLLDIDALDAAGTIVTQRVGTCGYVTGPHDSPANSVYLNALIDPGDFSRNMFGEGQTMGSGTSSGAGSFKIANADGEFDFWPQLVFDGRPFVLRRLNSPSDSYLSAEIVQTGVVETLDGTSGMVSFELVLHDRSKVLDKPLQTTRYAGTTTSGVSPVLTEGNADLKDQVKPLVFGTVLNIAPAPVNVPNRMFQVSDGPVTSITPWDGRAPIYSAGDFGDAATLKTQLTSSTGVKTGEFGTVLSEGLFGVRFSSNYPLTADVIEGASSKPGSVAQRILEHFGLVAGTDFDPASFAALDVAAPFDLGVTVSDDSTCAAVLAQVLQSVSGWLVADEDGVFSVGRFTGPAESTNNTITEPDILTGSSTDTIEMLGNPDTDGALVWRVVVNWGPLGLAQDSSQVATCVDDATKAFVSMQSRQVVAEMDAEFKELHPEAAELTITTRFILQADAQAEADRLLALYSVSRRAERLSMRREDVTFGLGDTVTLQLDRLGFEDGVNMVVIGLRQRRAEERIDLILWG